MACVPHQSKINSMPTSPAKFPTKIKANRPTQQYQSKPARSRHKLVRFQSSIYFNITNNMSNQQTNTTVSTKPKRFSKQPKDHQEPTICYHKPTRFQHNPTILFKLPTDQQQQTRVQTNQHYVNEKKQTRCH